MLFVFHNILGSLLSVLVYSNLAPPGQMDSALLGCFHPLQPGEEVVVDNLACFAASVASLRERRKSHVWG